MCKCWLNQDRVCDGDCPARYHPLYFPNYGHNSDCNILTALYLIADALKKTETHQNKERKITEKEKEEKNERMLVNSG